MTFIELITRVLIDAKLGTGDTTLAQLAKDYINKAIVQLSREKKYREGILANVELDLAGDGDPEATLPEDFIIEDEIRYSVLDGAVVIKSWILSERSGLVSPAPISGKPNTYYIAADSIIMLEPFAAIDATTDAVKMDYFRHLPLVEDTDATLAPMWDEEIISRAVAQLLLRENKLEQAKFKLSIDTTSNIPSPSDK